MDEIDRDFTQILLDLTMVSQASGAGIKPARRRAKATGDRPHGEKSTEAEHLRDRYGAAGRGRARREAILKDARQQLERAKKSPPSPDAEAWEKKVAADPRPARVVAEEEGVSHTWVLQLRKQHANG